MIDLSSIFNSTLLEVIAEVTIALTIIALVWVRNFLVSKLLCAIRWVKWFLTRRPYVILWTDVDFGLTSLLAHRLQVNFPQFTLHAVSEARLLVRYPVSPRATKSFMLLVTDVTKLSDSEKNRRHLEERISHHVTLGGGLIGSHDLIYRRTRNQHLQQVFGCEINDFRRFKSDIHYVVVDSQKTHPLCADLPAEFFLDDGEVITGNWSDDSTVLFDTGRPYHLPLVVVRTYGKGKVVWINSGDTADHPPRSIAEPQEHFVTLLSAALKWIATK